MKRGNCKTLITPTQTQNLDHADIEYERPVPRAPVLSSVALPTHEPLSSRHDIQLTIIWSRVIGSRRGVLLIIVLNETYESI